MSVVNQMGSTIFRSNITYVSYILLGSVALELMYGKVTDMLWRANNAGKLYDQIDWSQWRFLDFDDEDEDEDEDDE